MTPKKLFFCTVQPIPIHLSYPVRKSLIGIELYFFNFHAAMNGHGLLTHSMNA